MSEDVDIPAEHWDDMLTEADLEPLSGFESPIEPEVSEPEPETTTPAEPVQSRGSRTIPVSVASFEDTATPDQPNQEPEPTEEPQDIPGNTEQNENPEPEVTTDEQPNDAENRPAPDTDIEVEPTIYDEVYGVNPGFFDQEPTSYFIQVVDQVRSYASQLEDLDTFTNKLNQVIEVIDRKIGSRARNITIHPDQLVPFIADGLHGSDETEHKQRHVEEMTNELGELNHRAYDSMTPHDLLESYKEFIRKHSGAVDNRRAAVLAERQSILDKYRDAGREVSEAA